MTFDVRAFFDQFMKANLEQDLATLERMMHPDFVAEIPQSGERTVGFAAYRAQLESYPGGPPSTNISDAKVFGDEERWAMTPSFTVVPLAGNNQYTVLMRMQYPDGSWWRAIYLMELRDDRVLRMDSYFAPELEPPLLAKIGAGAPG